MRGNDGRQKRLFVNISLETKVPKDHPLRPLREMVNEALKSLSPLFSSMYSTIGRPSIPPEKLLRALLLQILYSIRSERMLVEQLDYNLLFRWFVGMAIDDPVWNASTFSKNRDRLIDSDIAVAFLQSVIDQARNAGLLSDEHFSVDGTLIEAWASLKSVHPKDEPPPSGGGRNPEVDFRGQRRVNKTHESSTDPQARLMRKGPNREAKLCYMGHVLMENRNGLAVDSRLTQASGTAERIAAVEMIEQVNGRHQITLAADKGYDERCFVAELEELNATPHIARKSRSSAVRPAIASQPGYLVSQRARKRVEEIFGWIKTVGGLRKTRHRGRRRVAWMFTFAVAAYNLVRMRNLGVMRP
jgi:transposase